jgi:hypothetical protein
MIPADRLYLDPGDRLTGRYDPPRRCHVITQWGPGAGGPRNVRVRYEGGATAVSPFSRRLRRADTTPDHADGCMPVPLKQPGTSVGGSVPGSAAAPPCPSQGGAVSAGVTDPPARPGSSPEPRDIPVPARTPQGVAGRAGAPAGDGCLAPPVPAGAHDETSDRCDAMVPVGVHDLGVILARCPATPDGWYRGVCRCGHSRVRGLCAGHARYTGASGCLECLELPDGLAHGCLLTIAPVAAP